MSRRRQDNSWRTAFREARNIPSDPPLRELAKFLARRAAEDDYEPLLMRQRKKKLREIKERSRPKET